MNKTPQELAHYLKYYNHWRRGLIDDPMPDPKELGQALDQVIAILEEKAQPQTIALSDCCEAPAVIKGKPGSNQWYACPDCYDPCDVFIRTTTTQPQ